MERNETLDVICERIKALEGEVFALRMQNKRMRVVIAALVFLAVLPYLIASGMQTQTFSVLRVERLEFVRDGELVASVHGLTVGEVSRLLAISDKDNEPIVIIASNTPDKNRGFNMMFFYSKRGKGGINLASTPDGNCMLLINNYMGNPVVCLGASVEKDAIGYGTGYLNISDKDGKERISLFIEPKNGSGKLQIARAPHQGSTEKAAVTIGVFPDGSGFVGTTNSLGLPLWSSPQW